MPGRYGNSEEAIAKEKAKGAILAAKAQEERAKKAAADAAKAQLHNKPTTAYGTFPLGGRKRTHKKRSHKRKTHRR